MVMRSIINLFLFICLIVVGFGVGNGVSSVLYAGWLLAWSVITCLVYGFDKLRAQRNQWRVAELTLNLLSLVGGFGGAWIGMFWFRHKTKHVAIKRWLWLSTLFHIGLLTFLVVRQ